MLLGSLLSGIIEEFVSKDRMIQILPKRKWLTVFLAAGMGIIFPVCECGVVPVIRRLLKKGVPFSAAVAYLLGGPIVNPIVGISTAVAYGFSGRIAAVRLLGGYIIAVAAGLIMGYIFKKDNPVIDEISVETTCCHHDHSHTNSIITRFSKSILHAGEEFYSVGRFLVAGAFIAALLQTAVTRQVFLENVSSSQHFSILFMMFLAFVLNLCSEADAFVAASFQSAGISLVSQMSFMLLGPILDAKLVLMYLKIFRKRTIIILPIVSIILVLIVSLALKYVGLK